MLKWLKGLRQNYLNLNFKTKGGVRIRIIEQPGLWMSDSECQQVIGDLAHVVSKMDKGNLEYGVVQGKKEALDRSILTIIYDRENVPVAFNALAFMDCILRGVSTKVVHLGLVVVDPNCRAKGFAWALYGLTTFLLYFKNHLRPLWISSVTQVPAVVGMVTASLTNVFPSGEEGEHRSFDHLVLARQIMNDYRLVFGVGSDATFNEDKFIIENSYTGGSDNLKKTFEEVQLHRDPKFNEYCKRHLDYKRGDDFLQIGQINLRTSWVYISRMVPRDSIMAVLSKITFTFLDSIMLPVTNWFASRQNFKELRPYR